MHILAKAALILVIILQADLITGSRLKRATINRQVEMQKLVAASKLFLNVTASSEQLIQLKRDLTRCAKKNVTFIRALFLGNLSAFIGSIIGRRKREVNLVEEQSYSSKFIDYSKEPLTRTQDINAIVTQATIIYKALPNNRLVAVRKFAEGIAANWLLRYPFLLAVLGITARCASTTSVG